jgi:hypothetical protein
MRNAGYAAVDSQYAILRSSIAAGFMSFVFLSSHFAGARLGNGCESTMASGEGSPEASGTESHLGSSDFSPVRVSCHVRPVRLSIRSAWRATCPDIKS